MNTQDPEIPALIDDALATAGIGTWLVSLDRQELYWSDVTRHLHEVAPGYQPAYENALGFYAPQAMPLVRQAVEDGMNSGTPWELEVPLVTARGRSIWVRVSGRAVLRGGRPAYLAGTIADVSAQRAALATNERLSFIMRQTRNAALITDRNGVVEWANDGFEGITGLAPKAMLGRRLWPLLRRRLTQATGRDDFHDRLALDTPFNMEIMLRRCDGDQTRLSVDVTPIAEPGAASHSYIVVGVDITARHRAEVAMRAEVERRLAAETLLRELQDAQPTAVIAYDSDERVIFFNSAYGTLFPRMAPAMKIGATLEEIVRYGIAHDQYSGIGHTPQQREAWLDAYLAAHRNPGPSRELELPGGEWLQLRERRSPSGYLVCTRTNITRLKRAEELAQRRAEEDPLTGLGNRSLLFRKLDGMIASRRGSDPAAACLLLLDLDHFKAINDSMGHPAGDALLHALATRARSMVRKEDTVARLGGDEFAILLPDIATPAQVISFIGRLRAKLEVPLQYGNGTITPSLSIGAAIFPDDGQDTGTLMRSADTALYQAKRQGRHCHSFFDRSIAAALQRRAYLAEKLRGAIGRGEVTIALQPQIGVAERNHIGFEALARWSDAGAPVHPSEFIPVAEEMGLIVSLGMQVLHNALAAMRELRRRGLRPGRVAVNVAAAQLLTDGFADDVRAALENHGMAPDRLEIELTETTLLDRSSERIVQVLQALGGMGVSIALDDFGTGYASLSHLTQFPVHRLKIDRRFVQGIGTGAAPSPIARTVIGLAHGLGMEAVAEGVETEAQLDYLKGVGCDLAQGYLAGRPLSLEEADAYLRIEAARPPPSITPMRILHH